MVFAGATLLPQSANATTPVLPPSSRAEELQAKIQALLAQISELQSRLAQLQGSSSPWCHDFRTNLRIGYAGPEVEALGVAFEKEGLIRGGFTTKFDENVASEVVRFQKKYKDEILAPLGLKYGTGYVGAKTREKLNTLYGCRAVVLRSTPTPTPSPVPTPTPTPIPTSPSVQPSITLLSPNGPEPLKVGDTYIIQWKSSPEIQSVEVMLIGTVDPIFFVKSASTTLTFRTLSKSEYAPKGYMRWIVVDPEILGFMSNTRYFKIAVHGFNKNDVEQFNYDSSDDYFRIVVSP